jgi:hypothetical protein
MSPEYYSRVPKYFILSYIPYTWLSPLLKDHLAHKFEKKDPALNLYCLNKSIIKLQMAKSKFRGT